MDNQFQGHFNTFNLPTWSQNKTSCCQTSNKTWSINTYTW